jgi:hypothetical protein
MFAWLDDILEYSNAPSELSTVLEHVLALCTEFDIKIHTGKWCFYTTEAKWFGKFILTSGLPLP